jgi:glycosyltransferase involved in cell wall biosynthesis
MDTICIYPRKFGLGGPASFQSRLIEELRANQVRVVFEPDDLSVAALLVIGGTRHLSELRAAKRRGVRVVQRLNGMNWVHKKKNTGLKHFLRAEVNNYLLATIRKRIADKIIYQSHFSQNWWNRIWGSVNKPETVVYNGVNLDQFNPAGVKDLPSDRYRMLLVEGNLGNGYEQGLFTAADAAALLNQRLEKPLDLMVVGSVPAPLRHQAEREGLHIDWRGVVDRRDIPEIDRSAHVFFSSDVNAACPNSVIEALACGLPVVAYDTGALPEMVTGEAGCIARYGTDLWKLQKPDVHSLVDAAGEVLRHRDLYSRGARARAEAEFDIKKITRTYIDVLLGDQ